MPRPAPNNCVEMDWQDSLRSPCQLHTKGVLLRINEKSIPKLSYERDMIMNDRVTEDALSLPAEGRLFWINLSKC